MQLVEVINKLEGVHCPRIVKVPSNINVSWSIYETWFKPKGITRYTFLSEMTIVNWGDIKLLPKARRD